MGVGGSSPLISTIKNSLVGLFFVIHPTLYLPKGKCKAFALLRVAPPLTSITPPLAPFKRWGSVAFTLKLSFKGTLVRVHSILPDLRAKFALIFIFYTPLKPFILKGFIRILSWWFVHKILLSNLCFYN